MDQYTRRIIGFGVHAADVDGTSYIKVLNQAISSMDTPKYLSSDHDPLFNYHQWAANLRVPDIDEIKSILYTPHLASLVERLIRTVRREFLDQIFVLNC